MGDWKWCRHLDWWKVQSMCNIKADLPPKKKYIYIYISTGEHSYKDKHTHTQIMWLLIVLFRFTWAHGDLYLEAGHLHTPRGQHTGSAGILEYLWNPYTFLQYVQCSSNFIVYFLFVENAWLSEGKKRCWLFQEFIRTHAVLQVKWSHNTQTNLWRFDIQAKQNRPCWKSRWVSFFELP